MRTRKIIKIFFSSLAMSIGIVFIIVMIIGAYYYGYIDGYNTSQAGVEAFLAELESVPASTPAAAPQKTNQPSQPTSIAIESADWGGPELWEAVNARRSDFGVSNLSSLGELCTIAAIRLNEQLEIGKLDNHEGFSNMPERREDLAWIFEKYSLSEFLLAGADSPEHAVSLWENTLGHKKLLDGGEYVWGCIYAQNGFAVAIAAF